MAAASTSCLLHAGGRPGCAPRTLGSAAFTLERQPRRRAEEAAVSGVLHGAVAAWRQPRRGAVDQRAPLRQEVVRRSEISAFHHRLRSR
ncbi:hypothetical protein EYF80_054539 [Liparis tanakae]|uniref:Uncharacterized protein n=1 Tax=Liparis tanakae TaxID=230148 RepID=A0A4Z2F319_9TELE|nr:hypothetical protein EYF80_054539 [Liparis tanakae]